MRKGRSSTVEKKTSIKNSVGRLLLAVLMLLLQFLWVEVLVSMLSDQYPIVNIVISVFAVVLVIAINENEKVMSLKAPIMLLILLVPVIGVIFFLLSELMSNTVLMRKKFEKNRNLTEEYLEDSSELIAEIASEDSHAAGTFSYLQDLCKYPVYSDTDITYFDDAAKALQSQIEAIKQAKEFVFLEYHAIEDKESFEQMKEALFERAEAGVDVRIIYDDLGSFVFINTDFIKRMEKHGIKCQVFNPIVPLFNLFINNRDHRKITVVDGRVGFTGGYNIANEYFNITHPYGEWKDAGIRLEGSAVNSLTAMFFEMWNSADRKLHDEDYAKFFPKHEEDCSKSIVNTKEEKSYKGFVAPYADNPIDDEPMGENVYISLINNSIDFVWFITPYLIITDELKRALQIAAKRGVDVRIVTPGIPDKKIVYQTTRSYYSELISAGVKIYEFSPGFCHAKLCLTDDKFAVCGTINLDFRSLYHHFENAVLLYDVAAIEDIKKDFEKTFKRSENVTSKYLKKQRGPLRVVQSLLRLIAPLF